MPRACARSMICARFCCSSSAGRPRSAVVAAERDDEDADVAVERPVEPREAAGRRVAGHAGVHDLVVRAPPRRDAAAAATDTPRSAGRPRPAVRLSPRTTIRGRRVGSRRRRRRSRRRRAPAGVGDAARRRSRADRRARPHARRAVDASAAPPATSSCDARLPSRATTELSPAALERAIACASIARCAAERAAPDRPRARASASSSVRRVALRLALLGVSARPRGCAAFGLRLLELDVLAFEASRHARSTVFYQYATARTIC